MRLTWIGAMIPAAFLLIIEEFSGRLIKKDLEVAIWIFASIISLAGMTPWTVERIVSYSSPIVWVCGPVEPWLRIGLAILIIPMIWVFVRLIFSRQAKESPRRSLVFAFGILGYSLSGLLSAVLLPFFKNYSLIESTSFFSIFWTTFFVWYVFSDLSKRTVVLSELDHIKKDLISNITHEFKSPLATVESAVEVLIGDLEDGRLDEIKIQEYLSIVKKNTGRLAQFIQDLLEVARIEKAKIELKLEPIDLNLLVVDVISFMKPQAKSKGLKLIFSAGIPVETVVDVEKVRQVIANLLSNALKFTDGGSVRVTLESDDKEAKVSVFDTGCGIDPKFLSSIFDRFYKVPGSSRASLKGTGLGLAIAKGWVEAHGGKLWAESKGLGQGTKLIFTIPLIKE